MNKEKTGRAIIVVNENNIKKIVTIKRTKFKEGNIEKIYYTIPGGHVENGETYEQATIREVEEELGITVNLTKEFLYLNNEDLNRDEKFFLCEILNGNIGTGTGPEWTNVDIEKYGKYEICLIELNEINNYNLLPIELKKKLIEKLIELK